MSFIHGAVNRKRVFLFGLILLIVFGFSTYTAMPKEAFPEVKIPFMITTVTQTGISPEDGERLIAKPLEKEFKGIDGLKHIDARCYEGYCNVVLEFEVGLDSEKSLRQTKDAVDKARPFMPKDIDEPTIREINTAEFPIAIVNIYGAAPEKTLIKVAEDLQDLIEALPGVLEADLGGKRKEQVEILIDPAKVDSYKFAISSIASQIGVSNVLIPAGNIETEHGSFPIKVPGLIETVGDILELPIKVAGDAVIKLFDVAQVRRNFENASQYVRMNKRPSLSLEVKKKVGANTIQIVRDVRQTINQARAYIPGNVVVTITNDASKNIVDNLTDLQNNVISAMLLVVVCVMLMLGVRTGLLVGFSIPVSFLLGILFLHFFGIGINMVVLFGLILAVGMLVDGAIVITEYADKKMTDGAHRAKAYAEASGRMAIPVISSTATTLMAFAPLVFWPGIMGEFMRYLPITVICILTASLIVALICVPILGAMIGKKGAVGQEEEREIIAIEHGDFSSLKGYMKKYHDMLDFALRRPVKIFFGVIGILIMSFILYGKFGVGIELFPDSEPDFVNINVHARGNLSIDEKSKLIGQVEDRVSELPYFKNVYSRSGAKSRRATEDVVGYIQVELKDWQERPKAKAIMSEMGRLLEDVSGVIIEIGEERKGPVSGKPIELEISAIADDPKLIAEGYKYVAGAMEKIGGFRNVDNTMPLPGIQWELVINKAQAAKFGIGVSQIGSIVQMMTRGSKVSSYMPADLDEEIDIVVRFPERFRALDQIDNLYVVTPSGASVPLSTFVKIVPGPKVNMIQRIDSRRIVRVSADVDEGTFAAKKIAEIKAHAAKTPPPKDVRLKFRGQEEDSRENSDFISRAFMIAVFMMFLTMLLQFNSFYSTGIIMFSIVLSTIGVILGLIATRDPFSITMTGLAVVSLAGIVINNNIILIDAFDEIKQKVADPVDALKRTGLQRLRPVYLTTITTMLGLLPMALKLNIDFTNADITVGAPSMGMWAAFSRSMIFGLGFSTVLTLVLTPCMILMGIRMKAGIKDWWRKRKAGRAAIRP